MEGEGQQVIQVPAPAVVGQGRVHLQGILSDGLGMILSPSRDGLDAFKAVRIPERGGPLPDMERRFGEAAPGAVQGRPGLTGPHAEGQRNRGVGDCARVPENPVGSPHGSFCAVSGLGGQFQV
ncbi:MAG: hypothetical protein IT210_07635 [Armatimonadetes bacterium]|nr:hypothetical protein [Armatimonadota bacterium]